MRYSIFENGKMKQNSSADGAGLWCYKQDQPERGTICLTEYNGDDTEISIPGQIGEYIVSALAKELFSPDKAGRDCRQKERLKKITAVTIPDSVTEIDYGVFAGCKSLNSITIPDSVTAIGNAAFAGCSGFKSITIPNSVTRIGNRGFADCRGLRSITIPESLTEIGYYAFRNCTGLGEIIFPRSVTEIGYGVFSGCEGLTDIEIPSGVTYIGGAAFENCSGIRSITVPAGVTSIGNYAFSGCTGLKSIAIPESVTRIGINVFRRCDALTDIFARPSQYGPAWFKETTVKTYLRQPEAFHNEKQIEDIKKFFFSRRHIFLPYIFEKDLVFGLHILAEANKINESRVDEDFVEPAIENAATQCIAFLMDWKHKSVFCIDEGELLLLELEKELSLDEDDPQHAADLRKLWAYKKIDDGTICLIGYNGAESEITIPESIGDFAVSALEDELFYPDRGERGRSNMPPKRKRTAEQKERLKKITSVTIPAGVTNIGKGAFRDCASLRSITLPGGVNSIGSYAFSGCTELVSITIPDSVTNIGGSVFDGCVNLSSITIPNTVTSIGSWAFAGCKKLTVFAPSGSYAARYAGENGIKYKDEK